MTIFNGFLQALGPDLYDDGFLNVTNIDISSVVINQMADMHRAKEEIECTQNNVSVVVSLLIIPLFSFAHGRTENGIYSRSVL